VSLEVRVHGMSCQHCVDAITTAVMRVPDASAVRVDLAGGVVNVEGSPDRDAVAAAIDDNGYDVEILR
jgi:copper chaperone